MYAIFQATVRKVDHAKKALLESKLAGQVTRPNGDSVDHRVELSLQTNGVSHVAQDLLGREWSPDGSDQY